MQVHEMEMQPDPEQQQTHPDENRREEDRVDCTRDGTGVRRQQYDDCKDECTEDHSEAGAESSSGTVRCWTPLPETPVVAAEGRGRCPS
jgi:hypothetical protein